MAELCILLNSPVRLASGEIADAGTSVRAEGRFRECRKLVEAGHAKPHLAEAGVLRLDGGSPGGVNPTHPSSGFHLPSDNDPTHLDGVKRRFKEVLLKEASKLSLTCAEPPPPGKSWFDVAAEARWKKISDRRGKEVEAEAEAEAWLLAWFGKEAEREEADAKAALARAQAKREAAVRAAELVSFDAAARELKIAQDTLNVFENTNDARSASARERLRVAEAKFAEATLTKNRYAYRVLVQRACDDLEKLGRKGSRFPRERFSDAKRIEQQLIPLLQADDFATLELELAELAQCLDVPQESMAGGGIAGFGV
jgi:hypothetical protein